jgi:error-prone DNA polymerase
MGLNYVKGLRGSTAQSIVAARKNGRFLTLRDLVKRVPQLQKDEISALAELGALNSLPKVEADRQRRGALWQAELALRPVTEMLEPVAVETDKSPLISMTPPQRTYSDFKNSSLSIGAHPMSYHRSALHSKGVFDAATAREQRNGFIIQVAGCVITRQRPGTAHGFVFISLEDETGIVNVIVQPDLFDRKRELCTNAPYVTVKGILQNIWNVVAVRAADIEELSFRELAAPPSHDFH